ncbi:hypothetical protein HZC31_03865 [Candidatus Woesearchaeota archaeon]|nr:hypothetical protein [Candidatus Woesearchaeota archaeon]
MVKWNVIAELWKKREIPSAEIFKYEYIDDFLRPEDIDPLMETGDLLHRKLYERGIDVALLAVGSSTFSEYHWEVREKLTTVDRFLGKRGERRYADIDIRVVVEGTSPALAQFSKHIDDTKNEQIIYMTVRDETRNVLSSHGYTVNDHWTVQKLHDDRMNRKRTLYGRELYSLTTMLRSNTLLDVIIREQQFPVQKELERERRSYGSLNLTDIGIVHSPFSVLYPSHAMSN